MIDRRAALLSTGAAALLLGLPATGRAQAVEALRMYIPAAPGGGWDQTGRSIEHVMKAAGLVKSMQFDNVPGAGGTVGLPRFVNQMRGRGDTLMVAGMVMVGAIIANKTAVNLTRTTPIARLTGEFEVVAVPAASPLKTMGDLVAMLKADAGKVSWAGGSAGGTDHILAAMIAQAVGLDAKRVNYVAYAGGGPAQAALLGGHVTAGISGWGEFSEQIKAGKLRALGISADKRIAGIDTPTLKEQGVDVELFNWRGVFAPPGISEADRKKLGDVVEAMVKSQPWREELTKRDWTDIFLAGDAFGKYIETETQRIEAILRAVGLAT